MDYVNSVNNEEVLRLYWGHEKDVISLKINEVFNITEDVISLKINEVFNITEEANKEVINLYRPNEIF